MAGRPAVLAIRITGNAQGATRALNQVQRQTNGLGSKLKSGLKAAGAAAAAGLAIGAAAALAFAKDSVRAASDVQQSMGAVESVFKKNAGQIKKWANSSATDVGLAKSEYLQMSATLGASLKNLGVDQADLGDTTRKLIKRAADMAAMFGGTTQEAVEALGAAFRGEYDPLEKYGVSIKQSGVNALLAKDGLDKLDGSARVQAETQAKLKLMFDQTKDSTGQFGRESDTLAGAQQRLTASTEDLKARLGEKLLPAMTTLATFARTTLLPIFERIWNHFGKVLGPIVGWLADVWRTKLQPAVVTVADAFKNRFLPMGREVLDFVKKKMIPVWKRDLKPAWDMVKRAVDHVTETLNENEDLWGLVKDAVKLFVKIIGSNAVRSITVIAGALAVITGALRDIAAAANWAIKKLKELWKFAKDKDFGGKGIGDWITGGMFGYRASGGAPAGQQAAAMMAAAGRTGPETWMLRPVTSVHVTIDGRQLQGRISRTVNKALNADGTRLSAGGWA